MASGKILHRIKLRRLVGARGEPVLRQRIGRRVVKGQGDVGHAVAVTATAGMSQYQGIRSRR